MAAWPRLAVKTAEGWRTSRVTGWQQSRQADTSAGWDHASRLAVLSCCGVPAVVHRLLRLAKVAARLRTPRTPRHSAAAAAWSARRVRVMRTHAIGKRMRCEKSRARSPRSRSVPSPGHRQPG
eukprot:6185534-Pleurochrysis_carterae.AAC.1